MALPLLPIGIALAERFLPQVIGAFAGDGAEDAARDAIDIAQQVTGKKTPEEARAALEANTELAQAYRLALLDHDRFRAQLSAEERKDIRATVLANVKDARGRDIQVRQLAGGENKRADAMVAMAAFGLVGTMCAIIGLAYLNSRYPETMSEAVFTALLVQLVNLGGVWGLCLRDAFNFEFGSSRGSKEKYKTLAGK